jgi:hypothetical protein
VLAYRCLPRETRATASDRLVGLDITTTTDGSFLSVVYRAANGASYDRGKQYLAQAHHDERGYYWEGHLRNNRSVGAVGSFMQGTSGRVYYETIHDIAKNDRIIATITADCEQAYASAPPTAPRQPYSVNVAAHELDAYIDCTVKVATAFALLSQEPAVVVVDAAKGQCSGERLAYVHAADRAGVDGSEAASIVDDSGRDQLLGVVLRTRAAAQTHPPQGPDAAPVKSEPL